MLIHCPRCGFSQPKDQYCAQCGVDMEAYKPKAVPVTQRIFQSTKTHVLILVLAAVFVGQYVIRGEEPQRWVQKITRAQGVTQSKSKWNSAAAVSQSGDSSEQTRNAERTADDVSLAELKNRELSVTGVTEQPIQVGSRTSEAPSEPLAPTFRISYAEVPSELVGKWVNESSNSGMYQNLPEYSAGILSDFKKKFDTSVHVLKVTEKKLSVGQSDTNFSGTLGEESGQMIGLAINIELRSVENGVVHGSVVVNRGQRQNRANFPAEFDLPKGAAFFMLGVLRGNSFQNERDALNMPPFQIFKSPDFVARKTEFVIILEPEYK